MADAGRQEILVVAGVAQEEHAHILDQIGIRTDVEIEIAAHAAARIDADVSGKGIGDVPGMFQRVPGHFHELAVLGIEDCRFFRGEAKEFGVEFIEPIQPGGSGDVIPVPDAGRVFARGDQLILGQGRDRFHAAPQIVPELFNRCGAGQIDGHADNGYRFGLRCAQAVRHLPLITCIHHVTDLQMPPATS